MFNREKEEQLLDFCVQQKLCFTKEDWLNFAAKRILSTEILVVALYLAGSDWYGHTSDLESIAEQLSPGCIGQFSTFAQKTQFEPSRFKNSLKIKLDYYEQSLF